MAIAQTTRVKILPLSQERRRHQRVKVDLLGRLMLEDRQEYPCRVINMSPGGMAVLATTPGKVGERVIAYIDHLGRLEGKITRELEKGFAMAIAATPRKRDKLAAQLTWLANRHILNLPEDRRHGRIVPRNPMARLILPNGTNIACRVIDMSLSGAAIAVPPPQRPPVGAAVTVGKTPGRVVRHIDDGFAMEFTRLQHPDNLEESVTGE
ncbi:MAG TPA: PilZ domain-containing protein [Xanthobacteraceae bacterium]|nr:PilZ domain-containing protein [Xanthobacteraceae bacterium]